MLDSTLEVIPVHVDGVIPQPQPEQTSMIARLSNTRVNHNIVAPTLTAYIPKEGMQDTSAVIICPGGGFHFINFEHEGAQVARWLNTQGIAAFVLKYRVISTPPDDRVFVANWVWDAGADLAAFSAWRTIKRSVELHVYAHGGHGFGMHQQNLPGDHWFEQFSLWLQSLTPEVLSHAE